MVIKGFYINLDRDTEKRELMSAQLERLGLSGVISRFAAIEPSQGMGTLSAGEYGCLLSHRALIIEHAGKDLLILEDDVVLADIFAKAVMSAAPAITESGFDILMLGQTVPYNLIDTHRELIGMAQAMEAAAAGAPVDPIVFDARKLYRFGTFGYLLTASGSRKLASVLAMPEATSGVAPIDGIIHRAIQNNVLKGGLIFPYVVGVNAELSSNMVHRTGGALRHELHASIVNSYLAGAAEEDVSAFLETLGDGRQDPRVMKLLMAVHRGLTSPRN